MCGKVRGAIEVVVREGGRVETLDNGGRSDEYDSGEVVEEEE